jgi:hypothetical protein
MLPLSKVKEFNYAFQNNNFQNNTIHNIPIRIGPLFDDIKCNTNVMKNYILIILDIEKLSKLHAYIWLI